MSRQLVSSQAIDGTSKRTDPHISALPLTVRLALAFLGGGFIGIPWLSPELFWTAWFGWVPLLFALRHASPGTALLCGWTTGTVCFAIASHWMLDFVAHLDDYSTFATVLLSLGFWLYAGLSLGLACLLFHWLTRRLGGAELLSFPLCLVGVMAVYPLLFQTHFAEAQSSFLPALQAVDLVGAKGLDIIMLLFAALVYRILVGQRHGTALRGNLVAVAILLGWFAYGVISLSVWDTRMQDWQLRRIGLVQPNDAVSLAVPEPPKGFSRENPEEM
ncbi:hypothetical protein, partial [Halopseudomonas sp.]|uniref:hypothetical protein n=1 Tax=Halopseudomonas sp. TaxID=2901191 RepID=UPI00356AB3F2